MLMLSASGLFSCRYESIFWYTGRMQSKGDLLRMKIHAHNSVFEEVCGVMTCVLVSYPPRMQWCA
jgi:hypothetical protein